jgi:hypothetical protein
MGAHHRTPLSSGGNVKQLEWMKRWQRLVTPAEPKATVRVAPRQPRRMAGTYSPLHAYLEHRYADLAVLTFEQIESLLGFALPDRARTHDDWWAGRGTDAGASAHADAWRLAGRTAKPNFLAGVVAFERVSS